MKTFYMNIFLTDNDHEGSIGNKYILVARTMIIEINLYKIIIWFIAVKSVNPKAEFGHH